MEVKKNGHTPVLLKTDELYSYDDDEIPIVLAWFIFRIRKL